MSNNSSEEKKPMSYTGVRRLKGVLIGFEVFVAIILVAGCLVYFVPSVRNSAIKIMTGTSVGRTVLGWFSKSSYENNVMDSDFNENEIVTNKNTSSGAKLTGYKEILLIGIDARGNGFDEEGINSDSMIVMHIDNDTGKVKMLSVYRDAYLEIIGADGQSLGYRSKVNSAYSVGGIQACINTLNTNLDLNISDYVVLNFTGVTRVVDALGGIDVKLTQDEVYQLNQHLADTKINTGLYAPNITKPGKAHLVGLQATTYMRIRHAAFTDPVTGEVIENDFGRTARQRLVITELVTQAKEAGISKLLDIVNMILNSNTEQERIIKTSMTYDEICQMVPLMFDFTLDGGSGFPVKYSASYYKVNGGDVTVPNGLEYNVMATHKFLYGDVDGYVVSDVIKQIDQTIQVETGVDSPAYVEGEIDATPGLAETTTEAAGK